MPNVNQFLPIFQIDSKEDIIEISKIDKSKQKYFGNGFFISENGYFATVAHIFRDVQLNYFGYYNGKFHKIEIIKHIFKNEDHEDHIDLAIGCINIEFNDYFDLKTIERVETDSKVKIIGYSNKFIPKPCNLIGSLQEFDLNLCEIAALCIDSKEYYSSEKDIRMNNFFEICFKFFDYRGLSGAIILNEDNHLIGFFKGGSCFPNGVYMKGQAIHIEIIKELFQEIAIS